MDEAHQSRAERRSASGVISIARVRSGCTRVPLSRVRRALPASAALHALVLYATTQIGWQSSPLARTAAAPSVVWLAARRIEPKSDERSTLLPDLEARAAVALAPPPPVEESEYERQPPRAERELPRAETELPREERKRPGEVQQDSTPRPAAAPEPAPRTAIDWEAERQRAAASVIQEQQEAPHRSFSLADLPERERTEGDAVPPTSIAEVMEDGCVIAKNRFQRMAMMLLGRCVREARGDLFADAKPSYLAKLPVCVDTRETDAGPVQSASRREYPTVKCRLVDPEEP